jgi:hypothetical protein
MNDRRVGTWIAVVVSAVGIVAVVASFALPLIRDTRQDIGVDEIYTEGIPGFSNVQQDILGVCGEVAGCIQGARSTEANFLRFDTREHASAFAEGASDRYQSNWIVIDYRDMSMSRDDRDFLEGYLDSLGNSD